MRDVFELLEAVDLTLSRAAHLIDDASMAPLASRAQSLRSRRGYVGDILVLAIAGGTGTGKSSVLNAIAGTEISSVSVLRPHTDHPVAWIPHAADDALRSALARIGITRQVEQDRFPELAVIDLPDMDSVAVWHRQMVEDLLPRIDAVLWLFEPEKYRDRVVHEEFLRELAGYRNQFIFALNQVDRLRRKDIQPVLDDLRSALTEDGFDDALVFALAAAPATGPAVGVEELREFLGDGLDVKRTALAKTVIDARNLVRDIAEAAGVWNAGPVGFDERWAGTAELTVRDLVGGSGPAATEEAICRLEDLVAAVGTEVGAGYGALLRSRFDRSRIEAEIGAARDSIEAGEAAALARLSEGAGAELRGILWDRSRLAATAAYAAVGADQLADDIGHLLRDSWPGVKTMSSSGT